MATKKDKHLRGASIDVADISSQLSQSTDDSSMDRTEAMFTRLTRIIVDSFNASMGLLVSSIEGKHVKFDAQSAELFNLAQKLDALETRVETSATTIKLQAEKIKSLVDENAALRSTIEGIDQYSRVDSVIVHGVPLPPQGQTENLMETLPPLLHRLMPAVTLSPNDISTVHRLPSSTPNSSATSGRQKPPRGHPKISTSTDKKFADDQSQAP